MIGDLEVILIFNKWRLFLVIGGTLPVFFFFFINSLLFSSSNSEATGLRGSMIFLR